MHYKLLNEDSQKTYAVIMESGDEVMEQLLSFAKEKKLKASQFTAIGAFKKAMLGYFDFSIKDYKKIPVEEQVEVLAFTGDVSMYKDEPKVHAHVVLGKSDGSTCGGHLLKGYAHPTLEIILTESPAWLKRKMDPDSEIPLISEN